ncbi:MAG: glutamine-hydrolyzing carbamoyl-phosphate synthase small subunit [bacterium]
MPRLEPAVLALENGQLFEGTAFGATGRVEGEVVFNTSMTGYQEVLTDPSYWGQIVAMTAPQIGNTGVNAEDPESEHPWLSGFIAREFSRKVSSHRATGSLAAYLESHGVVGLHGVDTRALTRLLREEGCLRGVLVSGEPLAAVTERQLLDAARAVPDISSLDAVGAVTSRAPWEWQSGRTGPTLAVIDVGLKRNILRSLAERGARVVVFPAGATADEILEIRPAGLFLTNGPGDPRSAGQVLETIRGLLGKLPIQGICLGHQLLALAAGADTFKLKFGHHGTNHPVLHERTGKIEITSQNHNFAVDEESVVSRGFEITHRSLFDGTVEGMAHKDLRVSSVQYHPEAAPGPHDSGYLFASFLEHVGGRA